MHANLRNGEHKVLRWHQRNKKSESFFKGLDVRRLPEVSRGASTDFKGDAPAKGYWPELPGNTFTKGSPRSPADGRAAPRTAPPL